MLFLCFLFFGVFSLPNKSGAPKIGQALALLRLRGLRQVVLALRGQPQAFVLSAPGFLAQRNSLHSVAQLSQIMLKRGSLPLLAFIAAGSHKMLFGHKKGYMG